MCDHIGQDCIPLYAINHSSGALFSVHILYRYMLMHDQKLTHCVCMPIYSVSSGCTVVLKLLT